MDTFILIAVTGVGLGALYFLVACGLTLIYGLMGVLNFAHGDRKSTRLNSSHT